MEVRLSSSWVLCWPSALAVLSRRGPDPGFTNLGCSDQIELVRG
jgi:hypothetical protein